MSDWHTKMPAKHSWISIVSATCAVLYWCFFFIPSWLLQKSVSFHCGPHLVNESELDTYKNLIFPNQDWDGYAAQVWQSALGAAKWQLEAMHPFIHLSLHSGSQRSGRVSDQAPTFSRAANLVLADRWTWAPPPCRERLSRPGAGTRPPGPCCLWFPVLASPVRQDPSRKSFEGHACEFFGSPLRPPQPLPTSSEVMQRQSEMSLKTLPL